MIEVYEGSLGGGKTLSAVRRMAEYVAAGGCVWTNITLQEWPWSCMERKRSYPGLRRYIQEVLGWEVQDGQINYFDRETLGTFHRQVPRGTAAKPVLVVFDEANEVFDSMDQQTTARETLSFLRQSRKVRIDLLFIVQVFSTANKRLRDLAEFRYLCMDMTWRRLPGTFFWWPLAQVRKIQYDRFGNYLCSHWFWKDGGLLGSYRTEEVYRDLGVKEGVQTSFVAKGEGGVMSLRWKFAIVLLCVFQAGQFVYTVISRAATKATHRGKELIAGVQPSPVSAAAPVAAPKEERQERNEAQGSGLNAGDYDVEFGRFSWWSPRPGRTTYLVSGVSYELGEWCPKGKVVFVSRNKIIVEQPGGRRLLICEGSGIQGRPKAS